MALKKPETIQLEDHEVVVTQVSEGEVVTHNKKNVRIGQTFEVTLDGKVLGRVSRHLVTRERRTPGRRYVNARWQSPGWVNQIGTEGHWFECRTKREGIEGLFRNRNYI